MLLMKFACILFILFSFSCAKTAISHQEKELVRQLSEIERQLNELNAMASTTSLANGLSGEEMVDNYLLQMENYQKEIETLIEKKQEVLSQISSRTAF
jgi:sugar-specific transcriptional regulator TrmB